MNTNEQSQYLTSRTAVLFHANASTQDGIAEKMTPQGVGEVLKESPDLDILSKSDKANAEHATDFDVPIYNIWKQKTKSEGSSHFGNSETRSLSSASPSPDPRTPSRRAGPGGRRSMRLRLTLA